MASKTTMQILAGGLAACALSAAGMDALTHRLWINMALSLLGVCASLAYALRIGESPADESPAGDSRAAHPEPLASLVEQAPIPLLTFTQSGGLRTANGAARRLFKTDDLVSDAPAKLLQTITSPEPGHPSVLMLYGRSYALGMSEMVSGADTTRLISLTDIQAEVRIAEATALRDLLRVLSHEIMNSLTPVANLAGVARDYLKDEASSSARAAHDALNLLSHRAEDLARFIEAYRSLAKLPQPVMQSVALQSLLRDVVSVFKQSLTHRSVSLELDLPGDDIQVDIDETLFTQALLNILTNAAEATYAVSDARIALHAQVGETEVRLLVCDNGSGVAESLQDQIFHAYVTTKPQGTGTGLNLARQIALAHGGDLVFCGRKDAWSAVFAFILPLRTA